MNLRDTNFQKWYEDNHPDFSWLEKPSWHQFRWRLPNNRWVTASRQFRSPESLQKVLSKHGPRDVYIGTSSWLTPLNLPRKSDTHLPHPVLIDHLVVFDIDFTPFSYIRLEAARKATLCLLEWLEENEDLDLLCITYSGGKGFHLIFKDNDRTLFSIPDASEREAAVRASRKKLLQRVLDARHPVDRTVTADTRRIIRLPGTLHGTTKWRCTRITRRTLSQPLNKWIGAVERVPEAIKMPYLPFSFTDWLKAMVKNSLAKREKRPSENGKQKMTMTKSSVESTILQMSTHVVGTKAQNVFATWLKGKESQGRLNEIASVLYDAGIGPVYKFSMRGNTLLFSPRAISKQQLAKIFRQLKFQQALSEVQQLGHHWVDLHELMEGEKISDSELVPIGVWEEIGMGKVTIPLSNGHLTLLKRLGVDPILPDSQFSGDHEPSLRFVVKR